MTEQDADKAINFIRDNAPAFAEAKAARVYIENALKSKKATLMANSDEKTIGGKEIEAYAHPAYEELLQGLRAAVEKEERIKWLMEGAKLKFEHYKILCFNNRVEARAMS